MSGGRFSLATLPLRSLGVFGENQLVAFAPPPAAKVFEVMSQLRRTVPCSAFGSAAAALVSFASCFQ